MQAINNNDFTQINQEIRIVDYFFSQSLVSCKTTNHLNLLNTDKKMQAISPSRIGVQIWFPLPRCSKQISLAFCNLVQANAKMTRCSILKLQWFHVAVKIKTISVKSPMSWYLHDPTTLNTTSKISSTTTNQFGTKSLGSIWQMNPVQTSRFTGRRLMQIPRVMEKGARIMIYFCTSFTWKAQRRLSLGIKMLRSLKSFATTDFMAL